MNKIMKIGIAAVVSAVAAVGCMTASSLATAKNTGDKWDNFKSYKTVPYQRMGFPTIDAIGKEFCILSDVFVKGVVIPMVEADKEGYTGIVAQFVEDVAAAKKDGKTENDVLQAWTDRYGADDVKKLGPAFEFVRAQQNGKNAMLAIVVSDLPKYVALSKRMPKAIDEIKASVKDPFKASKLVGTATQLGERIDALVLSANFVMILGSDRAAETKALQQYVNSFQSKVN